MNKLSKITRSIIEQIKQNNSHTADLIPVLNYPERIRDLKPFQSIKIRDLTNIIGRKFIWGHPDFEKQTESAFHEVKDLRNLNPEQILNLMPYLSLNVLRPVRSKLSLLAGARAV